MSGRWSFEIVQLTPPGRGAVATLLLDGPGAEEAIATCFRPRDTRPVAAIPRERLVFGHVPLPEGPDGAVSEEEVIVRRHSPESVEIHCHGGTAITDLIAQAFVAQGARWISWEQWARQRSPDPIAAEARIALASARTERTARILLDQYQGALRTAIDAIRQAIGDSQLSAAQEQIESLLARSPIGLHLVEPWRVVLAGPPNVGKSSLINVLLGYQRAIVHPTPGTTRDVVTAVTAIDGWPIELSDTAGLCESTEVVEQAGIALAAERLAAADLVVLVFDQSQPWSKANEELLASYPNAILVANKADLPQNPGVSHFASIATSAVQGEGIEDLAKAIISRLVPFPPPAGAAVPFERAHVSILEKAGQAICRGDASSADMALLDISVDSD